MRPRKLDRITINPAIMNRQPCIRGMRLTVLRVLETLALYSERADVKLAGIYLQNYAAPEQVREGLRSAGHFSSNTRGNPRRNCGTVTWRTILYSASNPRI